jgi:ABC-type transporter Mla subunit MlaD
MSDLTRDNRSLRQLVARSERFTSRLAPERRRLGDVVQVASGAMETLSARRTQMAATLQRAPRALTELRGFLDELRATTRPLGPAARTLSSTAPALKSTLDALEPFRVAATPTLDEAHAAAPALQRLADRATPVVKSAAPPVQSLSTLAQAAPPLTKALDASIDDVLGFVQGWARATQNRDGVGHYFQGQGIFGAEILRSAVNRLLAQAPSTNRRKRPSSQGSADRTPATGNRPSKPSDVLPKVPGSAPLKGALDGVGKILDGVVGGLPKAPQKPAGKDRDAGLLDFLLGP